MPDFGVALAWMILAPIAVIFDILAIVVIQHYRPLYHSTDVALMSLLVTGTMTSYFVIPIPAVLELGGLDWNFESCNFFTWLSTTLRFSQLLGFLVLNVYWVNALRTKSRHMFMSSFCMKISVLVSWFVSIVVGLAPVTGGTDLFGFYSSSSCHFLPSSVSIGFGVLIIVICLTCVAMGIASSADTLLIFRSMKHISLTKYNAGRFHIPTAPGVSGVARTGTPSIHAKYSELSLATELCRLAVCLTVVTSCLNLLPFVAMQFMLLFDDAHRGTLEDVTLWLQLVDALLLPHLMWMLSGRYRHAVCYFWKVYVMRDASAKEEDASACTLQSYKVRALDTQNHQQGKATINGTKKIQTNGTTSSPLPEQPTTTAGIRRPSSNKICPIEHRIDLSCEGQGRMFSSPSESYSVTDLDDGLTVLSSFPQQTTTTIKENGNGANGIISTTSAPPNPSHSHHQSNGEISSSHVEAYPNDVYSRPLSKIKPQRKHMINNSPASSSSSSGAKVAFAEVSGASSEHESPQPAASAVSSPAKSLLDTPKREIDVKRTASSCSRREWKEKMRKKHLPAIFVNNSMEDEKDERVVVYSNISEQNNFVNNSSIDSKNSPEIYEMKEVVETNESETKRDSYSNSTTTAAHKQQNLSEDNFYVSGEFHYNYLSDSFPRKLSLRTQSTVDSDGVCDMYESDDIGTILDTSMVSDNVSHVGVGVGNGGDTTAVTGVGTETTSGVTETDEQDGSGDTRNCVTSESDQVMHTDNSNADVETIPLDTKTNQDNPNPSPNVDDDNSKTVYSGPSKRSSSSIVKSSLEEFEENERRVLVNGTPDLVMDAERPVSRLKLIDLEVNTTHKNANNSIVVDTHETINDKQKDDVDGGGVGKDSGDLTSVLQDYDELETVSGPELLQLKQHALTTVKTAHEITFDSSSDDGGIDNEAFEGDGDDSRESADVTISNSDGRGFASHSFDNPSYSNTETPVSSNIQDGDDLSPQDMAERYVTGKEDSEESGSNQGNEQDSYNGEIHSNIINDKEVIFNHSEGGLKRGEFKTKNPFLRESFEVLVQSPEYQQKIHSPDNPFFITVKPLALPRQKTLESPRDTSSSPSDQQQPTLVVKETDESDNNSKPIVLSKPPLPSRPATVPPSLAARVKTRSASVGEDDAANTVKPPVPVRKPYHLTKQNSMELPSNDKEGEDRFNRPRTSSEDELENIFVKKDKNRNNSLDNNALHEDPYFPGEDPPTSTAISNDDCSSPVFYSMSPVKEPTVGFSNNASHDRPSVSSDNSIVLEPYGQRRRPWMEESLDSEQQISDDGSFSIAVPVTSQHSPGFTLGSNSFKNDDNAEEYDFDSVKIQGVTDSNNGGNDRSGRGSKSNSGSSSLFHSSSGSDSFNNKITPVSEEERPTFQFYQFDDDIEKGFEDALSIDYVTHTNVYSGFGLCFESIKEEPEDSLSESTSSFDGLGDSNSSALFKTQAVISRPSSRASVNSSPNLDANDFNTTAATTTTTNGGNTLSVYQGGDQSDFNFGDMDTVNYEKFASIGNEAFMTSERTSGDGREEIVFHSNGSSSASHSHPVPPSQTFSQTQNGTWGGSTFNNASKTVADPWSVGLSDGGGGGSSSKDIHNNNNFNSSDLKLSSSPWLEVKNNNIDMDMSFESDFSQQNEISNLADSGGLKHGDTSLKAQTVGGAFDLGTELHSGVNGDESSFDGLKGTEDPEVKPKTQTIHYDPVYF